MVSVTLDTNIYVSGLEFSGIGSRLLGMAHYGQIRLDVSDAIFDELMTVLRDDFAGDGYRIARHEVNLVSMSKLCRAVGNLKRSSRGPRRQPDSGMRCRRGFGFLVTEDKDLLRLGSFRGIRILRAREFLECGGG